MRAVSEHWRCERSPRCYKCSWNHALASYLPTFQMLKVVDLADRLSLVLMVACSCRDSCSLSPCHLEKPVASCSCRLAFSPGKSGTPCSCSCCLKRQDLTDPLSRVPCRVSCACHFSSSRNFAKWACWTRRLMLESVFLEHKEENWSNQWKDGRWRELFNRHIIKLFSKGWIC